MLFHRYRRALGRAVLAVVLVGVIFALLASAGRGSANFGASIGLGALISAVSAVGAIIVSALVMRFADPQFEKSETFRTATVFFTSGAGAFLAWVIVGIIEGFVRGTHEWIIVWFIIGFITSVVAAFAGFTLISLDERRLRLDTPEELSSQPHPGTTSAPPE